MAIDLKTLGNSIRKIREKRGFSQSQLAERAGLSQAAIAWIEHGKRASSLDVLNALGEALDVPSECLTILGSRSIANNTEATAFLASLQRLIESTVAAQQHSKSAAPVRKRKRAKRTSEMAHA